MSDNIFKLPVATQCRREAARMDNQNDDQAWAIFIRAADHIVALEASVKELEAENANTMREASSLAMSLWKRHYQEVSPEFGLCDSAAGIISQIDNMTAGVSNDLKQMEAENAELRKESKKDLHTLIKAAWYLHTGQSARQVIDFIRCRLAFKTKQQTDDEGEA